MKLPVRNLGFEPVIMADLAPGRASPSQTVASAHVQKLVLVTIWAYEGEEMTQRWLSEVTGIASATVHRAIRILVREGFLVEERVTPRSRRWTIDPEVLADRRLVDVRPKVGSPLSNKIHTMRRHPNGRLIARDEP